MRRARRSDKTFFTIYFSLFSFKDFLRASVERACWLLGHEIKPLSAWKGPNNCGVMSTKFLTSNSSISVVVNGSVVLDNVENIPSNVREDANLWPGGGGGTMDATAQPTVSQSTTSIRVSGGGTQIHAPEDRLKGDVQKRLYNEQSEARFRTSSENNSSFTISLPMVSGTDRPNEEDVRPNDNGDYYFVRASVASVVYQGEDSGCAEECGEDLPPREPVKLRVSFGPESGGQTVCYVEGQQMTRADTEAATPSVSSSGCESAGESSLMDDDDEELSDTGTILSRRGTIRGMKNHVRASIAALLENVGTKRQYGREECGRIVLYTTSMGVVRRTHDQCRRVRNILHTLIVRFEERDVFMNRNYQIEICDRLKSDRVLVPQLFVDGRLLGSADAIERLNETGELRRLLEPYKRDCVGEVCKLCGGFRFLPCTTCGGSKKSVQHRHQFSEDFVALRCMVCDENGLVQCHICYHEDRIDRS